MSIEEAQPNSQESPELLEGWERINGEPVCPDHARDIKDILMAIKIKDVPVEDMSDEKEFKSRQYEGRNIKCVMSDSVQGCESSVTLPPASVDKKEEE